jgi:hypothetical protein
MATLALAATPACDAKKDDAKKADAKKAGDKKADDTKADDKKADVKAEPTKADDTKAAPPATSEKIGIAECDEYVEKYSKCIQEKVPEASRKSMADAMDQSVKAWKEAASGPGKAGLASACKSALDAAKQATSSMGCTW